MLEQHEQDSAGVNVIPAHLQDILVRNPTINALVEGPTPEQPLIKQQPGGQDQESLEMANFSPILHSTILESNPNHQNQNTSEHIEEDPNQISPFVKIFDSMATANNSKSSFKCGTIRRLNAIVKDQRRTIRDLRKQVIMLKYSSDSGL